MKKEIETVMDRSAVPGLGMDTIAESAREFDTFDQVAGNPLHTIDYFHFGVNDKLRLLDAVRLAAGTTMDAGKRDLLTDYGDALEMDIKEYLDIMSM